MLVNFSLRVRTAQGKPGKPGKPGKRDLFEKIRENLENSGNFQTIFTTSGKTQGILLCQISLLSSLGYLATNQTNVLLTGTLTNPVTAFWIPFLSL